MQRLQQGSVPRDKQTDAQRKYSTVRSAVRLQRDSKLRSSVSARTIRWEAVFTLKKPGSNLGRTSLRAEEETDPATDHKKSKLDNAVSGPGPLCRCIMLFVLYVVEMRAWDKGLRIVCCGCR